MKKFKDWVKVKEAMIVTGDTDHIDGSVQGAPGGKPAPLSSVGPVKMKQKKQKK